MSAEDKGENQSERGADSSPSALPSLAESWQAVAERAGVDPLIGTLIGGRYLIKGILGKGGMSIVYEGSQAPVDRTVALKTLKFQMMGDPTLVKRFEREVKTLSKLNHPNIVTVFDCVLDDRGQPYFVMDCLAGKSLQELLASAVLLDPVRAQHIFIQCCSAVEHAHRHGIIHRDLKPGNIMILDGTGRDFVKVVDFGLARLAEDAQRLTQSGEIWGSPLYMSPEQSTAQDLDARSDIYSLGTVMFEALTGSPPFRGKTFLDTMTMQVNLPPPMFKEAAPAAVVPQAFEQVVRKCLVKDPEGRYQTMAELKEALKSVIPGHPYDGAIAGASNSSAVKLPVQQRSNSSAIKLPLQPKHNSGINKLPVTPKLRPAVNGYNYAAKGLSAKMLYGPLLAVVIIAASVVAFRGILWPASTALEAPHPVAPHALKLVAPPVSLIHSKGKSNPGSLAAPVTAHPALEPAKHAAHITPHVGPAEKLHRKKHAVVAVEAKPANKGAPALRPAPVDKFASLRSRESADYQKDKAQP
ncbi:MAG TPA: serine/threonine-protein kinase [Planktothrix sp.]